MDTDFSDRKLLEKYSSAFTLSDMEIFIFPDLFYPLVMANIMSPIIWEWRNDPWFKDVEKKGFTYKVNRIKQFIIQNYVFNLDLATWGLTTKTREIERFLGVCGRLLPAACHPFDSTKTCICCVNLLISISTFN